MTPQGLRSLVISLGLAVIVAAAVAVLLAVGSRP